MGNPKTEAKKNQVKRRKTRVKQFDRFHSLRKRLFGNAWNDLTPLSIEETVRKPAHMIGWPKYE